MAKSSFQRLSKVRSSQDPMEVLVLTLVSEPQMPEFNTAAMSQLESMGFPTIRCQKALLATGNSDPEAAMNWLFQHMEDPGMSHSSTRAGSLTCDSRHRRALASADSLRI